MGDRPGESRRGTLLGSRQVSPDLKPYSRYKDSGVPWLGQVPAQWEVRRVKTVTCLLVSNVDKHSLEGEEAVRLCNYVNVYKNDRLTSELRYMRASATLEEIDHFRLRIGDVIITKDSEMWNDIGVPALVDYEAPDLICGYHLAVLRPHHLSLAGSFLFRSIQSLRVATQFHVAANGVTRFGLSLGAIGDVRIPLPSTGEQAAIVRFLNYTDRRIHRYISTKRKLMALLNEQKQAIIDRAVTRGLDPGVRLKASGVPWLGDVPEHWSVIHLRRRWEVVDCKHLTVPFVESGSGIPLASVREVQPFDLNLSTANRTTDEWHAVLISGGRQPKRGDLIYCRNVSVGAAAYVNTDEQFAMGQDVCLIRSASESQRYLNYYLHSGAMMQQLSSLLIGSTFNRINISEIKSLIVLLPPRKEQDRIAEHLDRHLAVLEQLISTAGREIALIREYRTRLIADVVTGKLDVREAAASLPDEVEEAEALEEPNALEENGEDAENPDLDAPIEENDR